MSKKSDSSYRTNPSPIAPNNCPIRERTADGKSVGRCWHFVGRDGDRLCERHGDVTAQVAAFLRTGVAPIRTVTEVRILNEQPTEFSDPRREEIAAEKNLCGTCAIPWEEAARQKEENKYNTTLSAVQASYGVAG